MNSFEFNKMAGAVLGTALVVFGLKELAGAIYHSETPEKPGFMIEVAEAATGGEEAAGEPAAVVPLGTLLTTADASKGQAAVKACAACHDFTKGGPNKTGPNLWDIVGRNHAAIAGFPYSDAMKAKAAEPWTYEALFDFIHARRRWRCPAPRWYSAASRRISRGPTFWPTCRRFRTRRNRSPPRNGRKSVEDLTPAKSCR